VDPRRVSDVVSVRRNENILVEDQTSLGIGIDRTRMCPKEQLKIRRWGVMNPRRFASRTTDESSPTTIGAGGMTLRMCPLPGGTDFNPDTRFLVPSIGCHDLNKWKSITRM